MTKTAFTGGGTMGHVTPNLALIPELQKKGYSIIYIGSRNENEKKVVSDLGVKFYSIKTGKFRRYFDLKNITDIFNIISGFISSLKILRKQKPDLLFSKGGFVSVPVVFSAYLLKIPVILHESNITIGLANRLCIPFAKLICYSFEETKKYLGQKDMTLTGIPIRPGLLDGNKEKGYKICGFTETKPVLLIIGGSQGSRIINNKVYENLNELLKDFQVCHICGNDGVKSELLGLTGYKAFEYVHEDLKDIFAITDLVLSRAGATAIFELLALNKPNLLVPISANRSRGDQIKNAVQFEKKGFSRVIVEEELSGERLLKELRKTYERSEEVIKYMKEDTRLNSNKMIIELIDKYKKG